MGNELTVIFLQQPVVGTSVKYMLNGQVMDSAPITAVSLDSNTAGIYHVTTADGNVFGGPIQYPNQAPQPDYGAQFQNVVSGILPPNTPVPAELVGKLNWGAFLLGPFWSIAHRVWIGLLGFIPAISLVVSIVLLIKGNEWGWQSRKFESVDEFKKVQKAWLIWGLIIFAVGIALWIVGGILSVVFSGMTNRY